MSNEHCLAGIREQIRENARMIITHDIALKFGTVINGYEGPVAVIVLKQQGGYHAEIRVGPEYEEFTVMSPRETVQSALQDLLDFTCELAGTLRQEASAAGLVPARSYAQGLYTQLMRVAEAPWHDT